MISSPESDILQVRILKLLANEGGEGALNEFCEEYYIDVKIVEHNYLCLIAR